MFTHFNRLHCIIWICPHKLNQTYGRDRIEQNRRAERRQKNSSYTANFNRKIMCATVHVIFHVIYHVCQASRNPSGLHSSPCSCAKTGVSQFMRHFGIMALVVSSSNRTNFLSECLQFFFRKNINYAIVITKIYYVRDFFSRLIINLCYVPINHNMKQKHNIFMLL